MPEASRRHHLSIGQRIGLFGCGLFAVVMGVALFTRGMAMANAYFALLRSPALILAGSVLMGLGAFPDWFATKLRSRRGRKVRQFKTW
jgi:hypothetical protein